MSDNCFLESLSELQYQSDSNEFTNRFYVYRVELSLGCKVQR